MTTWLDAFGRRRRAGLAAAVGLAAVVVVAVAALVLLRGSGPSTAAPEGSSPAPGLPVAVDRPAAGFTRPLLGGRGSFDLSRYDHGIVVLNFWASNCDACRSEGPALGSLSRAFGPSGVRFVGVDYEDSTRAGVRFVRAHGMRYPSVVDANGTVADAYRVFGLPMTFIIGPGQRIRYVIIGKIDVPAFQAALRSLLRAATH